MRYGWYVVALLTALLLSACNERKVIPDDELASIFHDAYLANAYVLNEKVDVDSVDLYGPIFAKYGYTREDVEYTIGNFSERKSAKLADVVDEVIKRLERESGLYQVRVARLDSADRLIRDRYSKILFSDTLITVRRVSDTSKLHIELPVDLPGEYEVSYRYSIDSTDQNVLLRTRHYLVDRQGRRLSEVVHRLQRRRRGEFSRTFDVDTSIRSLVLDLNPYDLHPSPPRMQFDTVVVIRYLDPELAADSLIRSKFDYTFWPEMFRPVGTGDSLVSDTLPSVSHAQDSLPLPADSGRTALR